MVNPRFTLPFTEGQLKASAWVPKIAAIPSILGSLFIIQHVIRNKTRRKRVYHRLLLLMSCHDLIYAIKSFVSTWPVPASPYAYGSRGSVTACTAAGFLGHGGSLTSICYNGSLTLFFLLVVKMGWRETQIKKIAEPFLHAVPILIGWSTAVVGLPLQLYNPFGWTCWINTYPPGCTDNVDCQRGDNAGVYRWAFFHAELWAIFGFTIVAMFLIYKTILQQEKSLDKYAFRRSSLIQNSVVMQMQSPTGNNNTSQSRMASFGTLDSTMLQIPNSTRSLQFGNAGGGGRQLSSPNIINSDETNNESLSRIRSTKFAYQATLYVVVFFFTWFFPMLQTAMAVRSDVLYFPLILLSALLSSLQGFFNAVIYLRPRWQRYRQLHPSATIGELMKHAVLGGELEKNGKLTKSKRQIHRESTRISDNRTAAVLARGGGGGGNNPSVLESQSPTISGPFGEGRDSSRIINDRTSRTDASIDLAVIGEEEEETKSPVTREAFADEDHDTSSKQTMECMTNESAEDPVSQEEKDSVSDDGNDDEDADLYFD